MYTEICPVGAQLLGSDGKLCRASDADCVCDWGEGDQCPNARNPIFFMRMPGQNERRSRFL